MATTVTTTTMNTRTIMMMIIIVMATIFINAVIVSTFTCTTCRTTKDFSSFPFLSSSKLMSSSESFPLFATTNNNNNNRKSVSLSLSLSLSSSLKFRNTTKITKEGEEEVEEESLLDNDPSTTLTTMTKTTVIKSVEMDDVEFKQQQKQHSNYYIDNWNEMYDLLLKYNHREGHCNVHIDYYITKDGGRKNLGRWLSYQRQLKQRGTLDTRKEKLLANVGVIWRVVRPKQWERMFTLLEKYKHSSNGDCNVPRNYEEDGLNLGAWLSKQRLAKKVGKIDHVKQMRLEKLGIVWDTFSQQWDKKYNLLIQYKQREGNCSVPQNHKENNENLGGWLNKQRQRKKKGKLDDERLRKLEDIGVIWSFN